ncbi:MAG: response regulator [Planctomycetaceae bacterium]|nr:response regulator [Planctomycetota bacterium]NUN52435.1 response regulator [Planctomycetaceae bacterium]
MSGRILVVDDEPYIRDLVRETLKLRKYETGVAANGLEALDILAREAYDIVITDVVMPGMGGMDLVKQVKKSHPQVRIIVLTGYPRQSDIGDFLLQGADEFLSKPFRGNDLVEVIRRLEERSARSGGAAAGDSPSALPGGPGAGS